MSGGGSMPGGQVDSGHKGRQGGPSSISKIVPYLSDRLAPWTELRPGPSDDKGGPGDSPVSVRWLRAEAERRATMASLAGSNVALPPSPNADREARADDESAGARPAATIVPFPGTLRPVAETSVQVLSGGQTRGPDGEPAE